LVKFKVAIPARYASERLPGKPLRRIAGKPMLQYTFENATVSGAQDVVIATDDERVKTTAEGFGARVCMTSPRHCSGSDRLSEVSVRLGWNDDTILVNLQGDEPLMPGVNIRQVAEGLMRHPEACITTLCTPIQNAEEFNDPNVVKVVRDQKDFALYFSRAPIPALGTQGGRTVSNTRHACFRHIGLYAYSIGYLKIFTNSSRCDIERFERLEQLRALWRGDRIFVSEALECPGPGVDTAEDLVRVEKWLSLGME
jgi:3-deoxy-manno-octulosonate cytidylyltransferase (CMP-KDO synthetase)